MSHGDRNLTMRTHCRAVLTASLDARNRLTPVRQVLCATTIAVLALATSEARHTVLAVLSTVGLVAAGAGFLLRFRISGASTGRGGGAALLLLGLHRPTARACDALLGGRHPEVTRAAVLLVVIAAAAHALRAVPGRHP